MGDKQEFSTEILSVFIHGLQVDEIPEGTVKTVQRCVLDLVGAAVAGARCKSAVLSRETARLLIGAGAAEIWFTRDKSRAVGAAFANSAAASALDIDDGHRAAVGHPGSSIIPAVLAVAQEISAGWPETLVAIVIGYEIGIRVSAARDTSSLATLSTGRWCAFSVAAAASRLRGLSIQKTAEAMAIAGALSPELSAAGYSRIMGNQLKEGIPWGTLTGLWAVELASKGFTGPVDILDNPGYYDVKRITSGLRKRFAVDEVYFKPYACCRWIHCALDGVGRILQQNNLKPMDIVSIEVHTFERALRLNNYPDPDSIESAQYSIPFCLATAVVEGSSALLPIREDLLHRVDIIEVARRVSLHVASELDRLFPEQTAAKVVVWTDQGKLESMCYHPLGDSVSPMEWEMLVQKFKQITRGVLTESRQNKIIKAVEVLPVNGLEFLMENLGNAVE